MDGTICIVTGGAGSLGLASAKLLHKEDASVRIVDLNEADLKKAAGKIMRCARKPCHRPLGEQWRTDRTAGLERYRGTEEEKFMQVSFKAAVVALTLAGSCVLMAGCVVAPGPGGGEVAFGYSDGYWDRGHNWHGWNSPQAAASFRATNGSHYYDRRHDQDNNQGWNDNDRYWQH